MKTGIVKYDCGNITSVLNAFRKIGSEVELVEKPEDLHAYDLVVLPGVGAFENAMQSLRDTGFYTALQALYQRGDTPIIGICLGLQLMCNSSQEDGKHTGFGWIDAEVVPLRDFNAQLKVPHMGWNDIQAKNTHTFFDEKLSGKDFYFVHSYCVKVNNAAQCIATCDYATEFACIAANGPAFGMQFHPEKSQMTGLHLLQWIVDARKQQLATLNGEASHA